jgi:XTP/dITP diphosphohydrolase
MTSLRPARLLVASNNAGKLIELGEMLEGLPIELVPLARFPHLEEIAETGSTFAENARLKAAGYARQTGLTALADDSGLEIAALDGRPGVLSARYGGIDSGFDKKMARLLEELANVPDKFRRARFVCSIAVASSTGRIMHQAAGICNGLIASQPRGNRGFGYDPLFIPDGYDRTFGELSGAVKSKISHRANAFRTIIPFLRDFSVI